MPGQMSQVAHYIVDSDTCTATHLAVPIVRHAEDDEEVDARLRRALGEGAASHRSKGTDGRWWFGRQPWINPGFPFAGVCKGGH